MTNFLVLSICVIGIYASFLTWGVLQEQLSSQRFGPENLHFKAPFFINLIQNLFGFIVGFIYVQINDSNKKISVFSFKVLKPITIVALTQSISSPVGLSSLEHVDYLLYQLAKSCKLIPVMIVHMGYYKEKFPWYKHFVAIIVTIGVILFTLMNGKSELKSNDSGYLIVGVLYLSASLLLDGITNATQDVLFKNHKELTGAHLMCGLNLVSFFLTLIYTIVSGQLTYSIDFITKYPIVLKEILLYSICGAIGQIFIFVTLANFGSLILIMVTVTRKMMSMLISVFLFGHDLTYGQWFALFLVFGGIGFEAYYKLNKAKVKTN